MRRVYFIVSVCFLIAGLFSGMAAAVDADLHVHYARSYYDDDNSCDDPADDFVGGGYLISHGGDVGICLVQQQLEEHAPAFLPVVKLSATSSVLRL